MRTPTAFILLITLTALGAGAGCSTIGEDLSALTYGINPPTPSEAAVSMFDENNPDARRRGVILIANSPFGGVDAYVRAYRDKVQNERHPLVLAASIRALARYGEPADALLIEPRLNHENEAVRWESAKGLQRLHNQRVIGSLIETLRDESEAIDVRIASAMALGQYPEGRVFQALVAALDDRELATNEAAEQSLQTLTGHDLGVDPRQWLDWYNATTTPPFEDQEQFLYPTYSRNLAWWENVFVWTQPATEAPAPPAGLAGEGTPRTYENSGDDAG